MSAIPITAGEFIAMNSQREELLQELLREISRAFRSTILQRHHHHHFGRPNLSRPQIGVLFYLRGKPEGVAVKELAGEFGVTSGAITQIVNGLVERGLVSRVEDSSDRRMLKIRLSGKLHDRFTYIKDRQFQGFASVFEGLNDPEIKQLTTLLKKVGTHSKSEEN